MTLLLIALAAAPVSEQDLLAKIREAQSWHDSVRMSIHTTWQEKAAGAVREHQETYSQGDQGISWTSYSTETAPDKQPLAFKEYGIRTPLLRAKAHGQTISPYLYGIVSRRTEPGEVSRASDDIGSVMWGYNDRLDGHVCDVLGEANSLTITQEDVNGESCPVLSGENADGHLDLVVSPEKGYYPIRYRITHTSPSEGVRWECRDTISEFIQIDGKWIPTKSTRRFELVFLSSKEKRIADIETTLSNIELNPAFDAGAFTLAIMPDGTNLTDVDFGIEYFLKDGKLEPYVDHYSEVQELHDEIAGLAEPTRPTDAAPHSAGPVTPQTSTEALRTNRLRLMAGTIAAVAIISLTTAFTVRWRGKRKKDGTPPND